MLQHPEAREHDARPGVGASLATSAPEQLGTRGLSWTDARSLSEGPLEAAVPAFSNDVAEERQVTSAAPEAQAVVVSAAAGPNETTCTSATSQTMSEGRAGNAEHGSGEGNRGDGPLSMSSLNSNFQKLRGKVRKWAGSLKRDR